MNRYESLRSALREKPRSWLITGAAGFIGSNLVEALLQLDQKVVGLDNFSTGRRQNLDQVRVKVGAKRWKRFRFIKGDIRKPKNCGDALRGIEFVLHQAALGSVPRSIASPVRTHESNVDGFLNMLVASRDAGISRFVYAASSSTYGDHPALPKVEDRIGKPLSPYAATKLFNEIYADVFARCYGMRSVGLRYFIVFGPQQDPNGAYAAVIPRWIASLMKGESIVINGDGKTSRDFCYVANVVQANILAALGENPGIDNQVFNIAVGKRATLNQLFGMIRSLMLPRFPELRQATPEYRDFRPGDVRHSLADIGKARSLLGYAPTHDLRAGLVEALDWYLREARGGRA